MFFTFFLTLTLLSQIYDATQITCRGCYIFSYCCPLNYPASHSVRQSEPTKKRVE